MRRFREKMVCFVLMIGLFVSTTFASYASATNREGIDFE